MIDRLREKFQRLEFEWSVHALQRGAERAITEPEVLEVVASGEVIEDYPQDKYGPSCLLAGWTAMGRLLHVQLTDPARPLVKIITLYEPDPTDWLDHRTRRTP